MRTSEEKTPAPTARHTTPFFERNKNQHFFGPVTKPDSFFQKSSSPVIQPKLAIGRPNDKYEKEADAVAQQVVSSYAPVIQKKCTDCEKEESLQKQSQPEEEELQMQPMEEEEEMLQTQPMEEDEGLQLKPSLQLKEGARADRTEADSSIENSIANSRGGGRPPDSSSRSFMESRMQTDFSSVHIHTGDEAVQMNRELGARAFTVGSDIYFNKGEYRPETTEGKKLLAHELTHTVQQSGNSRIQRQEQSEAQVNKNFRPDRDVTSSPGAGEGSSRVNRCFTSPEFPDFRCLAYALKLDIDENLWSNAHHFYRVATLYPGNNELMWNTFLRYGLGVNLLKTSFGFLGTNETLGSVLSYGTGIGLKSYEFFRNGKLELDLPIHLGRGINLNFQLDLNADPENLTNIQGVQTGVGISGHF